MGIIFWIQSYLLCLLILGYFLLTMWIIPYHVEEDKKEMALEYTDYCYTGLAALFTTEAIIVIVGGKYDFNIILWLQCLFYIIVIIAFLLLQLWVIPTYVEEDKKSMAHTYTTYSFTGLSTLLTSQAVVTLLGSHVTEVPEVIPVSYIGGRR